MAGQLFDIGGLFADVLADPKAEKARDLESRKNEIGDGSGFGGDLRGMLARSSQNFSSGIRGGLQQAGSAVNPNFDIRTAPDKYRAVINAINPAAADAEQQYIEATKQYAPNKLPQLMQNIKKNKREEAAEARLVAQEGRAVTAASQATQTFENLKGGWENTNERNRIANQLANINLENAQEAKARPAAQKEWLMTTSAGRTPNYAQRLEGMSPADLNKEFERVEAMEGQIATGLRASIKSALGPEHDAIPLLEEMSAPQLQSIMGGITNKLITPATQILGSEKKGYTMFVTDPIDPTKTTQITLTEGTADPVSPPAAITGRIDDILEDIPDVDTSWWWGRGGMEVERPAGGTATGKEVLQERAGQFYQTLKPTEKTFKDRIRLASSALMEMDSGKATYSSINAVLDQYFPKTTSESLVDAAIAASDLASK